VQQLGPVLAAFMFSDQSFMGEWYDNQETTWRSYVAILFIVISFMVYKYLKKYLKGENLSDSQLVFNNREKTLFEKLWIDDQLQFTTSLHDSTINNDD
jgi:amino acid permease